MLLLFNIMDSRHSRNILYTQSDIFNTKTESSIKEFNKIKQTILRCGTVSNLLSKYNNNNNNNFNKEENQKKNSNNINDNNNKKYFRKTLNRQLTSAYLVRPTMKDILNQIDNSSEYKKTLKKKPEIQNKIEDNFDFSNSEAHKIFLKNKERQDKDLIVLGTDKEKYFKTNSSLANELMEKRMKKLKEMKEKNRNETPIRQIPDKNYLKKYMNFTTKNTGNLKYEFSNNATVNNVEYNKSNIFNDINKDKLNKKLIPNKKPKEIKKPLTARKIIKKDFNYIPNINWRNTNTALYYKPNDKNMTLQEIKHFNEKGEFGSKYSDYVHEKTLLTEKSMDNLFKDKLKKYKGLDEIHRKEEVFNINGKVNESNLDMNEIKKIFRNNGFHIYNDKETFFTNEQNKENLGNFCIRKDVEDQNFNNKISKVEKIIEDKMNIKITENKKLNDKNNNKDKIPPRINNKKKGQFFVVPTVMKNTGISDNIFKINNNKKVETPKENKNKKDKIN